MSATVIHVLKRVAPRTASRVLLLCGIYLSLSGLSCPPGSIQTLTRGRWSLHKERHGNLRTNTEVSGSFFANLCAADFCRDIKRGHSAKSGRVRATHLRNRASTKPRIRHLPCAGVGCLDKERRGNLRTDPLRATKVGSWADFSGNLAHFCPNSVLHRATMNSALDWLGAFCCLQPCGRIC